MDFEESGIENNPASTDNNTLKQNNEPIISFSPERCRFDSGTSNFQKSAPFSVADLQVEDSLETGAHANPNPSTLPLSCSSQVNNLDSVSTNLKNPSIAPSSSSVPVPLSSQQRALHGPLTRQQQPHLVLHNEASQLSHSHSSSSSTPFPSGLVISTHSPASIASATASSTNSSSLCPSSSSSINNPSSVLPAKAAVETNSISVMVNGAVLTSNNSTTSDLQKRLEKRIAQASAAAAAATSSNYQSAGKAVPNNDTILSDLLSSSGSSNNNGTLMPSCENNTENQITFSPHTTRRSSNANASFQQKIPASLWESGSSASDIELLWESKLCSSSKSAEEPSSKVNSETLMASTKATEVAQFQSGSKANSFSPEFGSESRNGEKSTEIGKSALISASRDEPAEASATATLDNAGSRVEESFGASSSNNNEGSRARSSAKENKGKGMSLRNNNATSMSSASASGSTSTSVVVVNSGFDIRKVSALLPPQRLAIPCKPNPQLQSSHSTAYNAKQTSTSVSSKASSTNSAETTNVTFSARSNNPTGTNVTGTIPPSVANVHKTSTRKASISESASGNGDVFVSSGNGNVRASSNSSKLSSEKKPLVQWDSDESEEELSFFPPSKRGVITDNLSIDNMSLSGEEEDLHLTPPRPLAKKCPCDPRSWLERREISAAHSHGDSLRSAVSKPCVIS